MTFEIFTIASHRNGICGAPFHAVLFQDQGAEASRKLAILFDQPSHCAVLDVAKLAAGDIAFRSNSWRGDQFEHSLRTAISKAERTPMSTKVGQVIAGYDNGSERENLIDLLADAMLWCDASGDSFDEVYGTARMHFTAESKTCKKGA